MSWPLMQFYRKTAICSIAAILQMNTIEAE